MPHEQHHPLIFHVHPDIAAQILTDGFNEVDYHLENTVFISSKNWGLENTPCFLHTSMKEKTRDTVESAAFGVEC